MDGPWRRLRTWRHHHHASAGWFLIARAIERTGGRDWAYIETVADRATAVTIATSRASDAGTSVWVHDGTAYSLLPTSERLDATEPIQISTHCDVCVQAVELYFAWTSDGDPVFGAVSICPHCGAKQQVEAVGRVVRATKTRPNTC